MKQGLNDDQCHIKLLLQTHFMEQRYVLVQNAVTATIQFMRSWRYQLTFEIEGEKCLGKIRETWLSLEQEIR